MKICKIYIKGYQQFQDVELDFTNPETGEPVDKVCFIGSNGTGKSKLLNLIKDSLVNITDKFEENRTFIKFQPAEQLLCIIYEHGGFYLHCLKSRFADFFKFFCTSNKAISYDEFKELTESGDWFVEAKWNLIGHTNAYLNDVKEKFNKESTLFVYSPAEDIYNDYLGIDDVPDTSLDEAQKLFDDYPRFHEVSQKTVADFWNQLMFQIRQREFLRNEFENRLENLEKTKKELLDTFSKMQPLILDSLAIVWNRILNKAGLCFDTTNAKYPIQLVDNLKAYIKLIKVLPRQSSHIAYNQLSTGIRNFIFRIGHIFSLYFNKEVDNGILIVDEPENSLYPDFLLDIIEIYRQVTIDKNNANNTQMFFATHSPIVAAQFQPHERIILDWNEDGSVKARKGVAPIGDDPNDILSSDFELKNLMGAEGQKMWDKYKDLKKKLIREKDETKKDELIHEINQIGTLYNFG